MRERRAPPAVAERSGRPQVIVWLTGACLRVREGHLIWLGIHFLDMVGKHPRNTRAVVLAYVCRCTAGVFHYGA